ncbi:MAG: glycosyltransferase, partial [Candidatus Hodarchaeota archaeon]
MWLKTPKFEDVKYPRVGPVPEGIHRPFWSVMIPTYNCKHYLEEAFNSVLEQDPGPDEMQIAV